jgi:hypothetical protein
MDARHNLDMPVCAWGPRMRAHKQAPSVCQRYNYSLSSSKSTVVRQEIPCITPMSCCWSIKVTCERVACQALYDLICAHDVPTWNASYKHRHSSALHATKFDCRVRPPSSVAYIGHSKKHTQTDTNEPAQCACTQRPHDTLVQSTHG